MIWVFMVGQRDWNHIQRSVVRLCLLLVECKTTHVFSKQELCRLIMSSVNVDCSLPI
jgi:hypothetical protein